MVKKQKNKRKAGIIKCAGEVLVRLKTDLAKRFLKTLLLDIICILAVVLLFSFAYVFVMFGWSRLGDVMPTAIGAAFAIANNPETLGSYSDQITDVKGRLDYFIWGSLTVIVLFVLSANLMFSAFQNRIFGVLEQKKRNVLWRYFFAGLLLFLVLLFGSFISIFIFKNPLNAVFFLTFTACFMLLANIVYFVLRKGLNFYPSLVKIFSLLNCRAFFLFFSVLAMFYVSGILLSLLFSLLSSAAGAAFLPIWVLLCWSLGRIVVYHINEVGWERE